MATKITKEDFQAYLKVQNSGKTNMFDLRNVVKLSGLTRETILEIMTNYRKYKKRWEVIEDMKQKTDNDEEQKIKYQIYRKLDRAQALVNEIKELMKKIDLLPLNYPDTKTLK